MTRPSGEMNKTNPFDDYFDMNELEASQKNRSSSLKNIDNDGEGNTKKVNVKHKKKTSPNVQTTSKDNTSKDMDNVLQRKSDTNDAIQQVIGISSTSLFPDIQWAQHQNKVSTSQMDDDTLRKRNYGTATTTTIDFQQEKKSQKDSSTTTGGGSMHDKDLEIGTPSKNNDISNNASSSSDGEEDDEFYSIPSEGTNSVISSNNDGNSQQNNIVGKASSRNDGAKPASILRQTSRNVAMEKTSDPKSSRKKRVAPLVFVHPGTNLTTPIEDDNAVLKFGKEQNRPRSYQSFVSPLLSALKVFGATADETSDCGGKERNDAIQSLNAEVGEHKAEKSPLNDDGDQPSWSRDNNNNLETNRKETPGIIDNCSPFNNGNDDAVGGRNRTRDGEEPPEGNDGVVGARPGNASGKAADGQKSSMDTPPRAHQTSRGKKSVGIGGGAMSLHEDDNYDESRNSNNIVLKELSSDAKDGNAEEGIHPWTPLIVLEELGTASSWALLFAPYFAFALSLLLDFNSRLSTNAVMLSSGAQRCLAKSGPATFPITPLPPAPCYYDYTCSGNDDACFRLATSTTLGYANDTSKSFWHEASGGVSATSGPLNDVPALSSFFYGDAFFANVSKDTLALVDKGSIYFHAILLQKTSDSSAGSWRPISAVEPTELFLACSASVEDGNTSSTTGWNCRSPRLIDVLFSTPGASVLTRSTVRLEVLFMLQKDAQKIDGATSSSNKSIPRKGSIRTVVGNVDLSSTEIVSGAVNKTSPKELLQQLVRSSRFEVEYEHPFYASLTKVVRVLMIVITLAFFRFWTWSMGVQGIFGMTPGCGCGVISGIRQTASKYWSGSQDEYRPLYRKREQHSLWESPWVVLPERRYIFALFICLLLVDNPLLAYVCYHPELFGSLKYHAMADAMGGIGVHGMLLLLLCIVEGLGYHTATLARKRADHQRRVLSQRKAAEYLAAATKDVSPSSHCDDHPANKYYDTFGDVDGSRVLAVSVLRMKHDPCGSSWADFLIPKITVFLAGAIAEGVTASARFPVYLKEDETGIWDKTELNRARRLYVTGSVIQLSVRVVWVILIMRSVFVSGDRLRRQPFLSTRSAQLAFRIIVGILSLGCGAVLLPFFGDVGSLSKKWFGNDSVSYPKNNLENFHDTQRPYTSKGQAEKPSLLTFLLRAVIHFTTRFPYSGSASSIGPGKLIYITVVVLEVGFIFLPSSYFYKSNEKEESLKFREKLICWRSSIPSELRRKLNNDKRVVVILARYTHTWRVFPLPICRSRGFRRQHRRSIRELSSSEGGGAHAGLRSATTKCPNESRRESLNDKHSVVILGRYAHSWRVHPLKNPGRLNFLLHPTAKDVLRGGHTAGKESREAPSPASAGGFRVSLGPYIPVFCLETAVLLVECSWQAYYSAGGQSSDESGLVPMSLESIGLQLEAALSDVATDTHAFVLSNKYPRVDGETDNVIVVAFRGSATRTNVTTDLKSRQVSLPEKLCGYQNRPAFTVRANEDIAIACTDDEIWDLSSGSLGPSDDLTLSYGESFYETPSPSKRSRSRIFSDEEGSPTSREVREDTQSVSLLSSCMRCSRSIVRSTPGARHALPCVHSGFLEAYSTVRQQVIEHVLEVLRRQVEKAVERVDSGNNNLLTLPKIYITGHSLGGGLAQLLALDIASNCQVALTANQVSGPRGEQNQHCNMKSSESSRRESDHLQHATEEPLTEPVSAQFEELKVEELNVQPPIAVYTFGQPRLGNRAFTRLYKRRVPHTFRVCCEGDAVTSLPPVACCGGFYKHAGLEVALDEGCTGNTLVGPTVVETLFRFSNMRTSVAAHSLERYLACLESAFTPAELQEVYHTRRGREDSNNMIPEWVTNASGR